MWLYTRYESYWRKILYALLPTGIYLSLKNGNLDIFSFSKFDEFGWNFPWLSFISGFFPQFFSGGRPEGSKRNLNFQSATWHHLKNFQRKAEGDQPVISVGYPSYALFYLQRTAKDDATILKKTNQQTFTIASVSRPLNMPYIFASRTALGN